MREVSASIVGILALWAVVVLVPGCSSTKNDGAKESGMEVVFLTRPTCVNSPVVEKRLLAAMEQINAESAFQVVDVGELSVDDYRTGYGTPTILVAGDDLMGAPRPRAAPPI